MNDNVIVPILGILTGIIIPLGVFVWLYLDAKNKRATIIEVAKTIDDPSKVEELLDALNDEKKKEPIEYRKRRNNNHFCWNRFISSRCDCIGTRSKGCRPIGWYNWSWDIYCWIPFSR